MNFQKKGLYGNAALCNIKPQKEQHPIHMTISNKYPISKSFQAYKYAYMKAMLSTIPTRNAMKIATSVAILCVFLAVSCEAWGWWNWNPQAYIEDWIEQAVISKAEGIYGKQKVARIVREYKRSGKSWQDFLAQHCKF